MSAKPNDFLIGISEFVGILLPGSAVAYASTPALNALAHEYSVALPDHGAAAWVGFAVIAYFAGHIVFLLGSFLDGAYEPIRKYFWPKDKDAAFTTATRIKLDLLKFDADAINTYKFATATLALNHEEGYAEVRQIEADSKFFRSMTVLAVVMVIASIAKGHASLALAFLVAVGFCAWRYVERRWKGTERACQFLVAMYGGTVPSEEL